MYDGNQKLWIILNDVEVDGTFANLEDMRKYTVTGCGSDANTLGQDAYILRCERISDGDST